MFLNDLKKQGEELVAKIETGEGDIESMSTELDGIMKKIDTMSKAKDIKNKLEGVVMEERRMPVVEDMTTKEDAHSLAFLKGLQGKSMGDNERNLVTPKNPSNKIPSHGVSAPESLKAAIFGKKVASRMGWRAKVLNPVDDVSLIPNAYDSRLSYIPGESVNLMDLCDIVRAERGNWFITRVDRTNCPSEHGVVAGWLTTGSQKPETEPVFNRIQINCHEIAGYTAVADRLFTRSAFDLMSELARMFRGTIKHQIDIAILQGAGDASQEPTGIIGYAGVDTQSRASGGDVTYADLVNLKHGINPRAEQGSVWVLQKDAYAYLEGTLATVDGRPLFAPTTASGPFDRLVGFPYLTTVDLNAALGAEGDVIFGNFKYYTLAIEDDVVFATDDGKGTGFKYNTTYVKAYASVGGVPREPDAFSVLLA